MYEQIDTNVIGIFTALHHAGFNGNVIFEQAYDPYGRLQYVSKEHQELEPGFNEAAAELAGLEVATINHRSTKLHVCYSDAETLFNPASVENTVANEELEEEHLFKWTNMANTKTFEGKADGPDIHATPEGYEQMAKQMKASCTYKS